MTLETVGNILCIFGTWLICDAYISIVVAIRWLNNGNSWKYDHSIRIVRGIIGLVLILIGVAL